MRTYQEEWLSLDAVLSGRMTKPWRGFIRMKEYYMWLLRQKLWMTEGVWNEWNDTNHNMNLSSREPTASICKLSMDSSNICAAWTYRSRPVCCRLILLFNRLLFVFVEYHNALCRHWEPEGPYSRFAVTYHHQLYGTISMFTIISEPS